MKGQEKAAAAFKGAGKTPKRDGSDNRGVKKHQNDKNAEKKQAKPAEKKQAKPAEQDNN